MKNFKMVTAEYYTKYEALLSVGPCAAARITCLGSQPCKGPYCLIPLAHGYWAPARPSPWNWKRILPSPFFPISMVLPFFYPFCPSPNLALLILVGNFSAPSFPAKMG